MISVIDAELFLSYQMMKIHPGSVLSERRPPVIVYDELVRPFSSD